MYRRSDARTQAPLRRRSRLERRESRETHEPIARSSRAAFWSTGQAAAPPSNVLRAEPADTFDRVRRFFLARYGSAVAWRAGWRLFVAARPSPQVVRALFELLPPLNLPEHRPTPADQVHLTLQFIGDTPENDVPEVVESIERSAAGLAPFDLRVERLITIPHPPPGKKGRMAPRLLAAATDAPPTLLELQRRLATRLARRPRERAGDSFLPHLTICRFREGAILRMIDEPVTGEGAARWRVDSVRLVRSALRRDGADHAVVESIPLGAR